MRIFLHIGTDKTGSTAVQQSLWVNRGWLQAHSTYLPTAGLGRDNGHARLLDALEPASLNALRNELLAAKASGYSQALLSYEGMSRYNNQQISTLHAALQEFPLTVLVYLREQAQIIQSAHLQWIKMNPEARSIRSIATPTGIGERLESFAFLRNPLRDYHRLLKRWRRYAPGAALKPVRFEREHLKGGDIVTDLLSQMQLGIDDGFSVAAGIRNPSLDVAGALLIERWRAQELAPTSLRNLIDITQSVINRQGGGNRYFLSKSAVQGLRRHFERSNRRLAREFLQDSSSPFELAESCWREQPLQIEIERADTLASIVHEVNQTPTLVNAARGQNLSGSVALKEGWRRQEHWGVWSIGNRSKISFRVLNSHLIEDVSRLQLTFRGRYHADTQASTRLIINGRDKGRHDLSAPNQQVNVEIDELLPYQVVELCLEHCTSRSDAADRGRRLAFALSAVEVVFK